MKQAQNIQNSFHSHEGQRKQFDLAVMMMEQSFRMAFTIQVHFLPSQSHLPPSHIA